MKRWDEVIFVGNLTTRLDSMFSELLDYAKGLRLQSSEQQDLAMAKAWGDLQPYLDRMRSMVALIQDGVSGVYPMAGIEGWMLDGQSDNLRHRFEAGMSLEYVALNCTMTMAELCEELGTDGAHKETLQKMRLASGAVAMCFTERKLPDKIYMQLVQADIIPNLGEDAAMEAIHKRCYDEGHAAAMADVKKQKDAEDAEIAAAREKVRAAEARKRAKAKSAKKAKT